MKHLEKRTADFAKKLDAVREELSASKRLSESQAQGQQETRPDAIECVSKKAQVESPKPDALGSVRKSLTPQAFAAQKRAAIRAVEKKRGPNARDLIIRREGEPTGASEKKSCYNDNFRPNEDYVYTAQGKGGFYQSQQQSNIGQSYLVLGQSVSTLWKDNWTRSQAKAAFDEHRRTMEEYDDCQNKFVVTKGPVSITRNGQALSEELGVCVKEPKTLEYQMQTRMRQEFVPPAEIAYQLADKDRKKAANFKYVEASKPKPTGTWQPQRMVSVNRYNEQQSHRAQDYNNAAQRELQLERAANGATKLYGESAHTRQFVEGLNQKELNELVALDEHLLRAGI